MASPDENEINPYRAPEADLEGSLGSVSSIVDPILLKKFREQVLALGVLWMIIGSVLFVPAGLGLSGNQAMSNLLSGNTPILIVFAAIGLAWFVLGLFSCLKHLWAIYIALALSYVSLLGNLLSVNMCGLVFVILVIIQAHRVIGWAKQIRAAGLPLTAKP